MREHFDGFLSEHGFAGIHSVVHTGDPGSDIARCAEELHVDLIVIPSHGYHGFKRLVLGSVAERVLRFATCPVLALRRDDAD